MYVLNNVDIDDISSGTILRIARDLGFEVQEPRIDVNIIYKFFDTNVNDTEEIWKLHNLKEELQRDIYNQFIKEVIGWLVDNNYIIEI